MTKSRSFPGRTDQIRPICRFILAEAHAAGVDDATCQQIELACDEAVTNIVEHAYGGDEMGQIDVRVDVTHNALRVTLQDTGKPFNPGNVPLPASLDESNPKAIDIGGLGIHLMRQLVDDVHYEFNDDGNKVTLVKKLLLKKDRPDDGVWHDEWDDVDVVGVRGRLDHTLIPDLDDQLMPLLNGGRHRILLDLTQTTYTNSGGLRVIVRAWRTARANGGDVILYGLDESLMNIFAMVGFDKILTIVPDVDSAKEQFTHSS